MSRPTRPRTPPAAAPVPVRRPEAERPGGSAQRRRAVRAAGEQPVVRRPVRGAARPAQQAPARRPTARVADLTRRLDGSRAGRRRRPGPRALAVLAACALVLAALGWVLLGSPWLRVEQVRITGTERTDLAAVQAVVDGAVGSPLAGVDTGALASDVSSLPLVAATDVERSWPSTLVVRVHEREAVAAVPSTGGGVDLVDGTGRVLVHADAAPSGVPVLSVDVERAGPDALQAALDVNGSLSTDVRSRTTSIAASSPDAVTLQVRDGPLVVWGDASRPERKAEVLLRLLADPAVATAEGVDVSAPDAPAVRP